MTLQSSNHRPLIISVLTKLSCSITCFVALLPADAVLAQITSDGSVPTTVEQLREIMRINGGQQVGNNLFHSFEEFSIPEGMEAIFENSADIQNIFARVTGNELSQINGILSTQGDANFFFINPNGIIFGENAQLNVGGSFLASTAESIEFEDDTKFSAKDQSQLLTVSFPVGLGLGSNPGSITVNGNGNQITSESPLQPIQFAQKPDGLSVPSGETLALIGNGIDFNGGIITVEGGKTYLTSVDSGTVNINKNDDRFSLSNGESTKFQDINLNQQSLINLTGEQSGVISLIGKNINLSNASFVLAQNRGTSSGSSLNINATEVLSLSGKVSQVSSNISSETFNSGSGADLNISAQQMQLQDSGRIRTNSFNLGMSGNVKVNIYDSIEMSTSSILATTFSAGNAGNVTVNAPQVRVNTGAIYSSTNGTGDGGNVTVNASLVEISGTAPKDRASISTTSFAAGDAGALTLHTKQLRVLNGASLSSSSFATGNAGVLDINASESVEVKGASDNLAISTNPQSTIRSAVQAVSPQGAKALGLPAVPTGDAGNITINTPSLIVDQQGLVSVENQGTGSAGTVAINAKDINLDNTGSITAAAASGEGGNIVINTMSLSAKKNSQITTNAGGQGNGGNINFDGEVLTGLENSDITANAIAGNGGNIKINSDYIFGLTSTTELTPFSDIIASSELGVDGTVTIYSPESNIGEEVIIVGRDERAIKDQDLVDEKCTSYNQQRVRVQDLGSPIAPSPFDFNYDEDLPSERVPIANSSPASDEEEIIQANTVKVLPDGRTFLVAETKSNHPVSQLQLCTRQ